MLLLQYEMRLHRSAIINEGKLVVASVYPVLLVCLPLCHNQFLCVSLRIAVLFCKKISAGTKEMGGGTK